MILTFRDELSTRIRIRIWIRDFYFRSDPDPGKNFPDPQPFYALSYIFMKDYHVLRNIGITTLRYTFHPPPH